MLNVGKMYGYKKLICPLFIIFMPKSYSTDYGTCYFLTWYDLYLFLVYAGPYTTHTGIIWTRHTSMTGHTGIQKMLSALLSSRKAFSIILVRLYCGATQTFLSANLLQFFHYREHEQG